LLFADLMRGPQGIADLARALRATVRHIDALLEAFPEEEVVVTTKMIQWLVQTDGGIAGLVLRLTLAIAIFPHRAQKVLGWFGGHGFKRTMKFFTDSGTPAVFALLAIAAEFLGPLGLAVGLLTRVAAFGIACVMLVAIVTVHWPHGFFMNWYGNQKGEGFEYHCLCSGSRSP
jgi:putative oxidoreductase